MSENSEFTFHFLKKKTFFLFITFLELEMGCCAACSVNFEGKNYTTITSRCKGPNYNTKSCCDSFLEFACPFSFEINDMGSDCADVMFSYINLYGKYPPGLFANMCKGSADNKEGIDCKSMDTNGAFKNIQSPAAVMFIIIPFLLQFLLFNHVFF